MNLITTVPVIKACCRQKIRTACSPVLFSYVQEGVFVLMQRSIESCTLSCVQLKCGSLFYHIVALSPHSVVCTNHL